MGKDSLVVSSGALFIASKVPRSCNLKRNLESDLVWVPKFLVAVPNEKSPFVVDSSSISKQGVDYYISRGRNSHSVWYADKEIEKTLNLSGYVFLPGELRDRNIKDSVYTLENSFIPDSSDLSQERLNVNIVLNNSFDYSVDSAHRLFTANLLGGDLFRAISFCLSNPSTSSFGYSCEHSGSVGLNSKMSGRLEISSEQEGQLIKVIKKDLEEKLPLLFL